MTAATGLTVQQIRHRREKALYKKYLENAKREVKEDSRKIVTNIGTSTPIPELHFPPMPLNNTQVEEIVIPFEAATSSVKPHESSSYNYAELHTTIRSISLAVSTNREERPTMPPTPRALRYNRREQLRTTQDLHETPTTTNIIPHDLSAVLRSLS